MCPTNVAPEPSIPIQRSGDIVGICSESFFVPTKTVSSTSRSKTTVSPKTRTSKGSAPTSHAGFASFDLHPRIQRGIEDLGFTTPTPIQQKAVPPGIEGRDLLACAMTGSGKTAAFLLPILERLMDAERGTTRALILAPTRELAAQIVEQFEGIARHTHLRAAAVYGGVGMGPQEAAFRRGVDVIVACPGRLLDHFRQPYARLKGLEILVLDEADRMLDMGFLPDIRRVLRHLPKPEQTMLFSATMPREIVDLSRDLLSSPVSLDVERPSAPATGVQQAVFEVRQDLKSRLLYELLAGDEIDNVLVFTRTKHRANRLAQYLAKRGVSSDRIHGNRTQGQRTKALANFKSGETRVLVATDIAARGIDVEALSHVINFDVPNIPEDYIHRVGRTARASATGEAFTFVSPQERGDLNGIERTLGKRIPRRRLDDFDLEAEGETLEIPIQERLAAHRARRKDERSRTRAKTERRGETSRPKSREESRETSRGPARRRRGATVEAQGRTGEARRSTGPGRAQGTSPSREGERSSGDRNRRKTETASREQTATGGTASRRRRHGRSSGEENRRGDSGQQQSGNRQEQAETGAAPRRARRPSLYV